MTAEENPPPQAGVGARVWTHPAGVHSQAAPEPHHFGAKYVFIEKTARMKPNMFHQELQQLQVVEADRG